MNGGKVEDIKKTLKDNPRGLTITEISEKVGLHRNTTARYLDVLSASGQVDLKEVGPSKVYFLSRRVPLSAMLNYSTDSVLVVDEDLEVVQINENFLDFLGVRRGEIIEKSLEGSSYFRDIESGLMNHIQSAINGEEYSGEISMASREQDKYFEVRVLPTTFVDGRTGATVVMQDITDRREAERELKRSERKFRSSFEASPDPTFLFDKEGVCRDINEVAVKMLGYEREEIVGKSLLQLPFSDEVIQETMDKFQRRQQGEEVSPYEVELTTKSGDTKWMEVNAGTFEEAGFEGEIVIARDITERKKAEEELRRSREEYMNLINSMEDVFVVHDLEGNFIEGNDFLFETLGYSEEELKSMDVKEITYSEEEEIERKLRQVKDEGSLKFEVEVKTKKGKEIPVEVNANLAEYGNKPAILSIARDITERKKMEQKLRESEERYREIFTNSRDALWVVRVKGKDEFLYEDVNREFSQNFTGMDKEYILGKRLTELYSQGFYKKETVESILKDYKQVVEEKSPLEKEQHLSLPVGERWHLTTLTPILNEDGKVALIIGSGKNITKRKNMEEKLRQSEERFRQLSEAAFDGLALHDNGRILEANQQLADMLGYELSELVGKNAIEITAPEYRDLVREKIISGYEGSYKAKLIKKDESGVKVEIRGKPTTYENRGVRATAIRKIDEQNGPEE